MANATTSADPTKTLWYVAIDLSVRCLSAVGLLFLGYAGWQLQRDGAVARDLVAEREQQGRSYLPQLRTLSELQFASNTAISVFTDPEGSTVASITRHGSRLTYLANSLVLPDGDPIVSITPADRYEGLTGRSHSLKLPLTCTALMLGEALSFEPRLRWKANARFSDTEEVTSWDVLFFHNGIRKLLVARSVSAENVTAILHVDSRSAPCWRQWLPQQGLPLPSYRTAVRGLAGELVEGTARVTNTTLAKHSTLAERYVEIRADILHSQP